MNSVCAHATSAAEMRSNAPSFISARLNSDGAPCVKGLTRYGWNFSVVFYGIIPSNPLARLLAWGESDKSGVTARIVPESFGIWEARIQRARSFCHPIIKNDSDMNRVALGRLLVVGSSTPRGIAASN
jgi:hypothetical protein